MPDLAKPGTPQCSGLQRPPEWCRHCLPQAHHEGRPLLDYQLRILQKISGANQAVLEEAGPSNEVSERSSSASAGFVPIFSFSIVKNEGSTAAGTKWSSPLGQRGTSGGLAHQAKDELCRI